MFSVDWIAVKIKNGSLSGHGSQLFFTALSLVSAFLLAAKSVTILTSGREALRRRSKKSEHLKTLEPYFSNILGHEPTF